MAREINPKAASLTPPGGWRSHLQDGEEIVWQGRPVQGLRFAPKDVINSVLFAVTFAIAAVWIFSGTSQGWMDRLPSEGITGILVLIAPPLVTLLVIHMVIGQYFLDARARSRTHYALTSSRALISTGNGRKVSAFVITALTKFDFVEHGSSEVTVIYDRKKRGTSGKGARIEKIGFHRAVAGKELFDLFSRVQMREA